MPKTAKDNMLTSNCSVASRPGPALGLALLAISLTACANIGPQPVAFDQNPGSNGAPTASGN